ncbi:MAG TPA: THUMP domain-containing protein [Candidatus Binatia bacterium]|jgi:tRNA(Ser,Leu) C12 N-acetylase TAN1
MAETIQHANVNLIITNRGLEPVRSLRFALRRAVRGGRVRGTGFRGILRLEAEGDPAEVAKLVYEECSQNVGHLTAVLATVESKEESIRDVAVQIAAAQIGSEESFSFRVNKRGTHGLKKDTSTLEREIGGAIWIALERKYQKRPRVNLKNPNITVIAEILGPIAAIGISRREWREEFQTRP